MTTEIKIIRTYGFDSKEGQISSTSRNNLTFINENWVFYNEPTVEIKDTLRKTIITVDPLALTDKNNILQIQGAIINQKTGKIILPAPDCLLNMTLSFSHKDKSKYTTTYQIKRVNISN